MSRSTSAAEKWRGIVDEQTSSGQTVAEYCRRRGIAASSLFAWKHRLTRAAEGAAPTFVEAKVRSEDCVGDERGGEAFPSQAAEGAASAGGGPSPAACIEIHLPGQRRIMVRRGFDPEALRQVVAVLETPT
jgi:hypothetical protein